jgi:hypothetical protein
MSKMESVRVRATTFAFDFFNNSSFKFPSIKFFLVKTIQDPSLVITDFLEKRIIHNDKLLANKSLEVLQL